MGEMLYAWGGVLKMHKRGRFRNCSYICVATIFLLLFLSGCFGPPRTQEMAEMRLREENEDEATIQKLIRIQDIGRDNFLRFSYHGDPHVRFCVGVNPHTPQDILSRLAKDDSDLVMQGVTRNPSLPEETLKELLTNESLLKYLVINPKLSEETILKIYRQHEIPLYYFASNPNCPKEIREKIMKSGDYTSKTILEKTQEMKAKYGSPQAQ